MPAFSTVFLSYLLVGAGAAALWRQVEGAVLARGVVAAKQMMPVRLLGAVLAVASLFFVFVMPPFCAPDETTHWLRSVQVAQGDFLPRRQLDQLGGDVPRWARQVLGLYAPEVATGGQRQTRPRFDAAYALRMDEKQAEFVDFRQSAIYPPTAFVPQALGIGIGKILGLSVWNMFFLARMLNAALAAALLAWALSWAADYWMWPTTLLLLPICLQQVNSLSPDAVLISSCVLLASLLYRAWQQQGSQQKTYVATALLIGLLSQVRLPLLGLLPLLWLPFWRTRLRWPFVPAMLLASTGACVLAAAWTLYALRLGVSLRPDLPSTAQALQAFCADPAVFARVLVQTVRVRMPDYSYMLIGALGWLDTSIGFDAVCAGKVALVCAALGLTQTALAAPWRQVGLVWFAMLGTFVSMEFIFYLTWTSPGAEVIEGFQGRYALCFLPFLILGIPALPQLRGARQILGWAGLLASARCLLSVPWTLLYRYYMA